MRGEDSTLDDVDCHIMQLSEEGISGRKGNLFILCLSRNIERYKEGRSAGEEALSISIMVFF